MPVTQVGGSGGGVSESSVNTLIQTAVNNLVASAPGALDTLNELATALGNDASFATTMTNALAAKASSTSVANALAGKEDVTNKSTSGSLGTSDSLYPSQKAVKTYVDAGIIGSLRADILNTSAKSAWDKLFLTTKGVWLKANATRIAVISANYPDMPVQTYNPFFAFNRLFIWAANGVFGSLRGGSTYVQTTSDFTNYTNRELVGLTVAPSQTSNNTSGYNNVIYSDGSKVLILDNFVAMASGRNCALGYSYSNNGTSFTSVMGKDANGNYVGLSAPCISGSVYSFYSTADDARIYTTDHINWSIATNSTGFSNPVHRMSNGTLYTLNGSNGCIVSTDNGQTWTAFTLPVNISHPNLHCIDFDGTNYVYVRNSSTVYYGTTMSLGSTATLTAPKDQVWFKNAAFIAISITSSDKIETCTNPATWTQRTLSNATIQSYVIYCDSKYFVIGNDRVMSSSDLATWTSEIASGILAQQLQTSVLSEQSVAQSGNNFMFLTTAGVLNIRQSGGSWSAVTDAQQNTNTGVISVLTNALNKVRA